MMEKLLKSKTMVRILELLLFSRELHLREIAKRIDGVPTYVGKELHNLHELGLVSNRRMGNLSLWRINRESPLYPEIKSLFLKTDALGSYLTEIFEKFPVDFALIYGSFAKGNENGGSDIDLLIVGELDEKELIRAIDTAEKTTGREISYIVWSGEEFQEKAVERHHLIINILKNPIIWIRGDELEFRRACK